MLSLLSYIAQDQLHGGGTTHKRLGPPTSLINKENAPILIEAFFSVKVPSSLGSVQLTKYKPAQRVLTHGAGWWSLLIGVRGRERFLYW